MFSVFRDPVIGLQALIQLKSGVMIKTVTGM